MSSVPAPPLPYPGHRWIGGDAVPSAYAQPSKAVCIGRNYAEHAKELGNPVPEAPLLFLKPATSFAPFKPSIVIPADRGECNHEPKIALLIGRALSRASEEEALGAVLGVGLALDLTLRELQTELKGRGQPWERAKAFDGSCPVGPFLPIETVRDAGGLEALGLRLEVNGEERQWGEVVEMIHPPGPLLAELTRSFTLRPGDLVLTGTPAGVGPLKEGDGLVAELFVGAKSLLHIRTKIVI